MYDLIYDLFLKTLNMSLAASWLILAVMTARLVLKKAPKWIAVFLWGIVALRLALPFSFESALSLIPSAEVFNADNIQYGTPAINSGVSSINSAVNPVLGEVFAPPPYAASINPLHFWMFIASMLWLIGAAVMLLYAAASYVWVRRSVAESVPCEGNIFLCDHVKSPFILGLLRPKIYLPSNMDAAAIEPVIAHEKAHLARRDHWWKPLGFLILTAHWFNPLCWIAYALLCRDIELACDEKAVRQMDLDGKKQYSTALLECSTGRRRIAICPLAFGEVGVKKRVKNVLRYKKPALWVIIAASVACAVVTVCFATNPVTEGPNAPFSGLPFAERPALVMNGNAYINLYMPVSSLPYGYQSAGKLTSEQANNTGLEGIEYFIHPSETEDFYTYQECGTPVNRNTLDNTKLQWAYIRWTIMDEGIETWKLTLDDVVILSQKGNALTWADFWRYQGQDIGSGLYIMRYEIDELFDVLVGGVPDEKPWYITLRVRNEAEDSMDLRTGDVSAFIKAHRNDVPKAVEPKPDGGGEPAPEEPDFSTLSDGQTAIYQAILEHNRSAAPTDLAPCVSFAELACIVEDGIGFSRYIHHGWALYEEYRVTDNGLETITGSHVPVAITFREDPSGTLTLEEYWEPRDGGYYAQDIREKFPAHIVEDGMDSQKFVLQQKQECYAQAVTVTGLDTNQVIGTLLETICGSPALSSNPGDYIEEHAAEYRALTYYGRYALKYCFTRFEAGGETGLDGHIMMRACEDIAAGWGENLPPANEMPTGQAWYGAFKNSALSLRAKYSEIELAENYPASYLLLSTLGEI